MESHDTSARVRKILLSTWDPLNAEPNPNLANEYDAYIPGIIDLLNREPTIERVIEHLRALEDYIGIGTPESVKRAAAEALLAAQ